MRIPTIQIHTQPARIAIKTTPSRIEIEQPHATLELSTTAPHVQMKSPRGELHIDQSKAWDALAVGSHLSTMDAIYSEVRNIVLNTISRIAGEGDQLAAIHRQTNAIADIAQNRRIDRFELAFAGPPSPDNVEVTYQEHKVEFEPILGEVNLRVESNPPKIQFVNGKVDIYPTQYSKIDIIPPQIDLQV